MQAHELHAAKGELKHVPKYVTDCGSRGGDFENPLPICCNCCDRNHLKLHSKSCALRNPWCSKGFIVCSQPITKVRKHSKCWFGRCVFTDSVFLTPLMLPSGYLISLLFI